MKGKAAQHDLAMSRRGFLAGMIAAPVLASRAAAEAAPVVLRVRSRIIDVNGRDAKVFGIFNGDGGMGHAYVLDKRFRARIVNELEEDTLIHWHGLRPPAEQDGVPMLSQEPIRPGAEHGYDFVNTRSGTHWMHSHLGLQEQNLLAAPLIVRETEAPMFDDLEHVVMLHDFSFRPAAEILAGLQSGGHGMDGMHSDIVFDAFLANDRTLIDPEILRVEPGMSLRLRIVNGSAATNMWIDLGQLAGELIAVDGNAVAPVAGSLFPLAIAQRADVRIKIEQAGHWPILFRPEGLTARMGIVLATPQASIDKITAKGEMPPPLGLQFEAKLRAVAVLPDEPVTRTEILDLTGGGPDYVWGLNGKASMHDTLFTVREGERVEVVMRNQTSMAHPMHLHGHYFKITAINGQRIDGALRDTVLVPAGESVAIRFDADNPGAWAFHCHHLYHMNAGMMGAIRYSSAA
jgi:FtsP/CotA-like multicopper oxidase with cupredoxin domain